MEDVGPEWARDLFRGFCSEVLIRQAIGDVVARVDRAAGTMAAVARAVPHAGDVTVPTIIVAVGAEVVRRLQRLFSFLSVELGLNWSGIDEVVEAAKLGRLLDACGSHV